MAAGDRRGMGNGVGNGPGAGGVGRAKKGGVGRNDGEAKKQNHCKNRNNNNMNLFLYSTTKFHRLLSGASIQHSPVLEAWKRGCDAWHDLSCPGRGRNAILWRRQDKCVVNHSAPFQATSDGFFRVGTSFV